VEAFPIGVPDVESSVWNGLAIDVPEQAGDAPRDSLPRRTDAPRGLAFDGLDTHQGEGLKESRQGTNAD
jgi:hypothetical protein